MKLKFKKRYLLIIVVLGLVGAVVFLKRAPKTEYLTVKAVKGRLTQTVSDTGTVKTAQEIDLNFVGSGKISKINAAIGDKIKQGQVLAELDSSTLVLNQRQAAASLALAQASMQRLLNGASVSDLSVAVASARQAEVAYQNAQLNFEKVKKSTDAAVSQAQKTFNDLSSPTNTSANNKRDAVITSIEDKITAAKTALDVDGRTLADENAKDTLSIQDLGQLAAAKESLALAQGMIPAAESDKNAAKLDRSDANIDLAYGSTGKLLNQTYDALNKSYQALQRTVVSSKLSQTALDALKSGISAQSTVITAGISSLQSTYQILKDSLSAAANALDNANASSEQQQAAARAQIDAAFTAWQLSKAQLAKLQSPPRAEDIETARAQVAAAQAALDAASIQLLNNQIKAPIDGVITKKNYEVGETVTPSKPVFSMLSKNNFEVTVDISETDINKLKIGNPAQITFDAFGEEQKFSASVTFIEPAQTVIQDVIYYKTTVDKLVYPDGATSSDRWNIKPGMTANITITALEKADVLLIPQRAVIEKDDKSKVVRVLEGGAAAEKPVTLGLRGDDGLIEVLSGLNAGEEVITSVKNAAVK